MIDLDALTKDLLDAGYFAVPDPDDSESILVFQSEQSCEDGGDWFTISAWGQFGVSSLSVWTWPSTDVIRKHIEGATS